MIKRNHSQRKSTSPSPAARRGRGRSYAPFSQDPKDRGASFFDTQSDLGDCNEQESEKMGFVPFEEREAEPRTEEDGERLPTLSAVQLPEATSEEEGDPDSAPQEPKLLSEGEEPPRKEYREMHGGKGRAWIAVLTVLLLFAMLTLLVSVLASRAPEGTEEGFVNLPATDTQGGEEKPDRVIFVKQYDDDSGILSTAQLYAERVASVVSILTKGDKTAGIGSGFFLTADGYVATANHVVAGMDTLTVVEADGTRHRAVLVAGNALTDLALLKIEKEDCPPLTFAPSDGLLIGERVIAIGTPASLDYAGSVCSGELSYVGRRVSIYGEDGQIEKKMILLQTDASLNPGNSGCPLFDEYGNVIGIVTMRLGDAYEGMGFAIPSSGAMEILHAMMRGEELSDELLSAVSTAAPSLGILGEAQSEGGVLGVRVVDFSSATAPVAYILKKGDLIVQIDGTPVASRADVLSAIQQKIPGDRVSVTVLRSGQWLTFQLTLTSSAERSE